MATSELKIANGRLIGYSGKGKHIEIPCDVYEIGEGAFRGSENLTSVEYWDSAEEIESTIGAYAFAECGSLKSILFGVQVVEIGEGAFCGCESLGSVYYLGDAEDFSYLAIGENNACFQNATVYYYSPQRPNGAGNFWYYQDGEPLLWSGAKDFSIKDGVLKKYTGEGEDVTVPLGVSAIGARAFKQCASLKKVVLPEGVAAIGEDVFRGCKTLETVVLLEGVTAIGSFAFAECPKLKCVELPAGIKIIPNGLFSDCRGLAQVKIPVGVTTIDIWAFSGCGSLTRVELPEGVREIAFSAFHGCKVLESIVLPRSLSFIEGRAFAACDRLARVFYKGSAEEFAEIEFEDRENAPFVAATKYFYSEEQPLSGNYWHYADGVPTEW